MSDLGTPHVPPVNWSQVPAELWPLPVADPAQLELDFSDGQRAFLGDLDALAPIGIQAALAPPDAED